MNGQEKFLVLMAQTTMKGKKELSILIVCQIVDYTMILTAKLKSLEGITEKLKTEDQLAWVRAMNSIRNRAEEIVTNELIIN